MWNKKEVSPAVKGICYCIYL